MKHAYFVCLILLLTATFLLSQSNSPTPSAPGTTFKEPQPGDPNYQIRQLYLHRNDSADAKKAYEDAQQKVVAQQNVLPEARQNGTNKSCPVAQQVYMWDSSTKSMGNTPTCLPPGWEIIPPGAGGCPAGYVPGAPVPPRNDICVGPRSASRPSEHPPYVHSCPAGTKQRSPETGPEGRQQFMADCLGKPIAETKCPAGLQYFAPPYSEAQCRAWLDTCPKGFTGYWLGGGNHKGILKCTAEPEVATVSGFTQAHPVTITSTSLGFTAIFPNQPLHTRDVSDYFGAPLTTDDFYATDKNGKYEVVVGVSLGLPSTLGTIENVIKGVSLASSGVLAREGNCRPEMPPLCRLALIDSLPNGGYTLDMVVIENLHVYQVMFTTNASGSMSYPTAGTTLLNSFSFIN